MKESRMVLVLAPLITLLIHASPSAAQTQWADIHGSVTHEGTPLCAMVLANGQYMFTCGDSLGVWDLEVPLDSSGVITLYGFCSGFSPCKTVLTPSEASNFDMAMIRAAAGSREIEITTRTEPGSSNPNWVRISGTVTYGGTPLCAMVLANGQAMFSCGADLGTFDLEVPLDGNGDITLYGFASGFAPYKEVFLDPDQGFYRSSGINVSSLTETQVEHLSLLGRVWGFLKYHHPHITGGELQWDFELFRVIPKVLQASHGVNLQNILTEWVAELGVPQSCDPCAEEAQNTHLLPEMGWIRDAALLGAELSDQLQSVHANRFSGDDQFYVAQADIGARNPVFDQELAYESQELPDAGFRILALFRLWNIIEYWFPYRDLLDDDWESVLQEFLPSFVEVESWDGYKLELLRFIALIRDTHANLWSALDVRPPRGTCYWPVEIRFIEGRATIVAFTDSGLGLASGLEIGDIIETVDGRSIESLIEEWSPYYCASNQTTRMAHIAAYLPRGDCDESILTIDRDGQPWTVALTRTPDWRSWYSPHDRSGETFQLLSPEVAYIKLSSIQVQDVVNYIQQASGTRGLVIDIRNYPSEFVVFELGRRLVERVTPFARFTVGDLDNPGAFTWTTANALYPFAPFYNGKIAILVDEMSISQAEYTAMALRAGPRAVVVGSTTAGADGNVSEIPLPGGLSTMISGIGVFYPDKTPTQRVGIIPDIVAMPTRDGIRAGRDEVLEAALSHILGTPVDEEIQRMAKRE
jgi:C-terminal processing protease CtpA/Prc